jgi:hypothetical protein
MPLQKLQFKPGLTSNNTSLSNEGGWYTGDKVRFRNGFPEKIGGWVRISSAVYQGVCRSLAVWRTQASTILTGVGTHLKMYIESGGAYNDITPLRLTQSTAANAYTTTNGSAVVLVTSVAHGAATGDFVTISASATAVGGIAAATFNGAYQITFVSVNTYQITVATVATSGATGGNGTFAYEVAVGEALSTAYPGTYGTGAYGSSTWGAIAGVRNARLWIQVPYGQDLVFGPRDGIPYYWTCDPTPTTFNRGVAISTLPGASSVPLFQSGMLVDQSARILIFFGANAYGTTTYNPLLVRWSDTESVVEWAPSATTQAGEYLLSVGSSIVAQVHISNNIFILTDAAAYTMQYVGYPVVFSFAQQADNVSIAGPNAAIASNGIVYWMGVDKFYYFDGRVHTLNCPVSDHVFDNINLTQLYQTAAGTTESFDEIIWHYCSASATSPDSYISFNYTDNVWAFGTMARTAWIDSGLKAGPLGATTVNNLVLHEQGSDDLSTASTQALNVSVESADFDIGDGHNIGFVRSILPDITFVNSSAATPSVTMEVRTRNNPGAAHNADVAQTVARVSTVEVEQWTQQVFIRARGRQMSFKVSSNTIGSHWKIGTPRIDTRPDGRRS